MYSLRGTIDLLDGRVVRIRGRIERIANYQTFGLASVPERGCATFLCRQRAPFLGHRPLAGFFTGGFLKDSGPADDVAFSNIGITYRF